MRDLTLHRISGSFPFALTLLSGSLFWVSFAHANCGDWHSPNLTCLRMLGNIKNECYDKNGILMVGNVPSPCPTPTESHCTVNCEQTETMVWTQQAIGDMQKTLNRLNGPLKKSLADLAKSGSEGLGNSASLSAATSGEGGGPPIANQIGSATESSSPSAGTGQFSRMLGSGGSGNNPSSAALGGASDPSSLTQNPEGALGAGAMEVASAAYATSGGFDPATGQNRQNTSGLSGGPGKSNELSFGKEASTSISLDPKAIASEDPSDYFSRLKSDSDIFRSIHDRYLTKSQSLLEAVSELLKKDQPTSNKLK